MNMPHKRTMYYLTKVHSRFSGLKHKAWMIPPLHAKGWKIKLMCADALTPSSKLKPTLCAVQPEVLYIGEKLSSLQSYETNDTCMP